MTKLQTNIDIANLLTDAGFKFEQEPNLAGVQPDFLVTAPNGRELVIETKQWKGFPGLTTRAADHAKAYTNILDTDGTYVVVPGLLRSRMADGVVTPSTLLDALNNEASKPKSRRRKKKHKVAQNEIFAAMPFKPEYYDTFEAMAGAAKHHGAVCRRVDYEDFSGNIVAEIKKMIRKSKVVIADLSDSRPNVLFETGFAHALRKPIIQICCTDLEKVPFDVYQEPTLKYSIGQTRKLERILRSKLESFLKGAG